MDRPSPTIHHLFPLALLSAATIVFEINLTRIFSVAQFYHFAFLIVSLALLGIGASGTFLTIFPFFNQKVTESELAGICCAAGGTMLGSFLLMQFFPLDAYTVVWDPRQVFLFIFHFITLSLPFFMGGLATGILLIRFSKNAGRIYAANLIGSSSGCLVAVTAPVWFGGEGMVTVSMGLACLAALWLLAYHLFLSHRLLLQDCLLFVTSFTLILFDVIDLGERIINQKTIFEFMNLRISPYKSLSYALQYPTAKIVSEDWNAYSRVDVVSSSGLRSLPGLSYRYTGPVPSEYGIMTDGENMSPVIDPETNLDFTHYMPSSLLYEFIPGANVLVLNAGGGLEVLIAKNEGAVQITAVEENPLVMKAASPIYRMDGVSVVKENSRSYIQRSQETFDIIVLPIPGSYYPIQSGAYSLSENYLYTVESIREILDRLRPGGVILISRWLQQPPSEWLRSFTTVVSALDEEGLDAGKNLVAFRTYNTGYLLITNTPYTPETLKIVRQAFVERAYDIDYAPDIQEGEINRFNILKEPIYYQEFISFFSAKSRTDYYSQYPYDITPVTDNHPFFGHYFKWSQVPFILRQLGVTWQPFGGAGYLVVIFIFILVLFLSAVFILLPLFLLQVRGSHKTVIENRLDKNSLYVLGYFALLGLGYLLVEIPLIQQFILFLGQPVYGLAIVLLSILLCSGLGSICVSKISHRLSLVCLVILLILVFMVLPAILKVFLGLPLWLRMSLAVLFLAPLGFLMGMMFPRGILAIESTRPGIIPWAWALNGAASVIASVLSTLLALAFGFQVVLITGTVCYALCLGIVPKLVISRFQSRHP